MPNDTQTNQQPDTFTYDSSSSSQFQAGANNGTYSADYQNEQDTHVSLWHHTLDNISETTAHAAFTDPHNFNFSESSKAETIIDGNHNQQHPATNHLDHPVASHLEHLQPVEHVAPAAAPLEFNPTIHFHPEQHSIFHHEGYGSQHADTAHHGGHENSHGHSGHEHAHHSDTSHHGGSDSVH